MILHDDHIQEISTGRMTQRKVGIVNRILLILRLSWFKNKYTTSVHGWLEEMVDKTVAIIEEKLGVVVEKLGKC